MNSKPAESLPEAHIIGTGHYVPDKVLTNQDLEKMVDTSDEWIVSRTGIKTRYICADGQAVAGMSEMAARRALEMAGLTPQDLDMIIVATFTGDYLLPSTACHLQRRLGVPRIPAFDLAAACTGFVYALTIASQFVKTGAYKNILVVGSDKLTAYTDWTDRNTCVLFGDGAGAAIVSSNGDGGVIGGFDLGAEGELTELIHIPVGGSLNPVTEENIGERGQYIKMSGKELFKAAVQKIEETLRNLTAKEGISIDEIKYIVPHQANVRILQAVAKSLGIDMEKVYLNLEKYGNTSAASTPICFDEVVRGNNLKRGDKLVLVAFGGGFTYGSCLIEW